MQAKLRQVGNSVGLTIPASELKGLSAKAGDIIELEIKSVVHHVRDGWNDAALWQGANDEPLYLESVPESSFDDDGWKW